MKQSDTNEYLLIGGAALLAYLLLKPKPVTTLPVLTTGAGTTAIVPTSASTVNTVTQAATGVAALLSKLLGSNTAATTAAPAGSTSAASTTDLGTGSLSTLTFGDSLPDYTNPIYTTPTPTLTLTDPLTTCDDCFEDDGNDDSITGIGVATTPKIAAAATTKQLVYATVNPTATPSAASAAPITNMVKAATNTCCNGGGASLGSLRAKMLIRKR
jgi:hypothetical protein